jgi:uncharacterized membrane protein HdeD (DUF308 family)
LVAWFGWLNARLGVAWCIHGLIETVHGLNVRREERYLLQVASALVSIKN